MPKDVNSDFMPNLRFVFLVGLPSSGKSSAYRSLKRNIEKMAAENGKPHFSVNKCDDFPELQYTYDQERREDRYFYFEQSGTTFRVVNPEVYQVVLRRMNKRLLKQSYPTGLQFIEFSRNKYDLAFDQFSLGILRRAAILEVSCDLEACLERNAGRQEHWENHPEDRDKPDMHYVPDEVMNHYYKTNGNGKDYSGFFEDLPLQAYQRIDSRGTEEDFIEKVERFFEEVLKERLEQVM